MSTNTDTKINPTVPVPGASAPRSLRPGRRRRGLRGICAILVMVCALLLSTASDADAAPLERERIHDCSYSSARLLGWIWADGSYNSDSRTFFLRTKSAAISSHIKSSLRRLGLDYRQGTSSSGHDTYTIAIRGYGESFLDRDPMRVENASCRAKAFLASVIETEGNTGGKVLDDPSAIRRNAVVSMLDDLRIDSTRDRQNVYAKRADWHEFRSLPFVVCGRVPGGDRYCSAS